MTSSKYCLLKVAMNPDVDPICDSYKCAWFDEFGGECAIQSLRALEGIAKKLCNKEEKTAAL